MDWQNILTQIVLSLVGLVISVGGTWLTYLISKKVKNEDLKNMLSDALKIVQNGVDYTYQTYVEALKGTDFWDKEAMKVAKDKAAEYIHDNLTDEVKKYIESTGKTLEEWIKQQIEIAIKKSKDSAKK